MINKRDLEAVQPFLTGQPNASGEARMRCPLHGEDKNPSASLNVQSGQWYCQACHQGGTLRSLVSIIKHGSKGPQEPSGEEIGKARYIPWDDDNVISLSTRKKAKQDPDLSETITDAKVRRFVKFLHEMPSLLRYLTDDRHLTLETIAEFELGFDEGRERFTLPVRDADGALVNIRRYKPNPKPPAVKMINAMGHGSPSRLYPMQNLKADTIIVCEGEWDALVTTQNGFPAVTGTHGAGTWQSSWSAQFVGKNVYVIYDNDHEGKAGARKAAKSIARKAAKVSIVQLPGLPEHGDLTDWWAHQGTPEAFRGLLTDSKASVGVGTDPVGSESVPMARPKLIPLAATMDASLCGQPLEMVVTISGKKNPTYFVPKKVRFECTMDAGPKCKVCPMNQEWTGEHTAVVKERDIGTISKLRDVTEAQTIDVLRKMEGIVKCNRLTVEEIERYSIEELFVTGSIDKRRDHEEVDYTTRRIFNIDGHDTSTNSTAIVVGTTVPSPKDRRNEFFNWQLTEASTNIDKFEVTEGFVERMKVFQPRDGETPRQRCRVIAKDLSDNVTGIVGRERLHMSMDLVYHSILHFNFGDRPMTRGWLEFLVVGDTRTGKSETAQHLSNHYNLGHVIGCEGATFAGLIGGVQQIGNSWTVTWGEVTLNDRRLVVLDEASGLSTDIISKMSDVRSRGMAQLTMIESHQTRARCRMIWISNPRVSKFVNEKKYDGIDIIEDLIGNPEDIARFDFAMNVSSDDVIDINNPDRPKVPHVYTGELCQELLLWAWSRKAEHVQWKPDAYTKVFKLAEWIGKRYVETPPLVQRANVREKIARLAVAMAARTFSTDDKGEAVIVEVAHVVDAVRFIDELFSYDNFGYLRLSERTQRNQRRANNNRIKIRKYLLSHPRLLEFLLDHRSSFRAQDLEEMVGMMRDEAMQALNTLADVKMISKDKSQILLEPELNKLLKEIERSRKRKQ